MRRPALLLGALVCLFVALALARTAWGQGSGDCATPITWIALPDGERFDDRMIMRWLEALERIDGTGFVAGRVFLDTQSSGGRLTFIDDASDPTRAQMRREGCADSYIRSVNVGSLLSALDAAARYDENAAVPFCDPVPYERAPIGWQDIPANVGAALGHAITSAVVQRDGGVIEDRATLDAISAWVTREGFTPDWYNGAAPVAGYPAYRVWLWFEGRSPDETPDAMMAVYDDQNGSATYYVAIWSKARLNDCTSMEIRQHPDRGWWAVDAVAVDATLDGAFPANVKAKY